MANGFFYRGMFGGLSLAMAAPALAMFTVAPSAMAGAQSEMLPVLSSPAVRRRREAGFQDALPPKYRNKRRPGRPKKRRNMVHVSRRTRRKHRRARAA